MSTPASTSKVASQPTGSYASLLAIAIPYRLRSKKLSPIKTGPLYKAIVIAPATQINTPPTFVLPSILCQFTVSELPNRRSPHKQFSLQLLIYSPFTYTSHQENIALTWNW
jgi:hypothetical protein